MLVHLAKTSADLQWFRLESQLAKEDPLIKSSIRVLCYANTNLRYASDVEQAQQVVKNWMSSGKVPQAMIAALTALLLNTGCAPQEIPNLAQTPTSQSNLASYQTTEYLPVGSFKEVTTSKTNMSWKSSNTSVATVRNVGNKIQLVGVGKGTAQAVGTDDEDPTRIETFTIVVQ